MPHEIVRRGALSIDGEKMQTTWNGAPVTLSLTEFWIVHALARNPGHVKNRQQLMDAANVVLDDNTITSHIKRVRRKFLEIDASFRCHPNRVRNGLSLGRVSIRLQLLIVALTTLVLPWAGCQYARELETALRASQENALEASADTIAHALSAQPARVFRDVDDIEPFAQKPRGSLCLSPAWPAAARRLSGGLGSGGGAQAAADRDAAIRRACRRAITERYLFLYLEVDDPHFVAEPADVHPEHDRFDRVDLTLQTPDGSLESYFFATGAPGLIEAQTVVKGDDGVDRAAERAAHPGLLAADLSRLSPGSAPALEPGGRAPLDRGARRRRRPQCRVIAADATLRGGRLFMATPGLDELLATFIRPGTRATVIDANALKLGVAGTLGLERGRGGCG